MTEAPRLGQPKPVVKPEIWVITYNFSTAGGSVSHLSLGCYFPNKADAVAYMERNHMRHTGNQWPMYRAEQLTEHKA